MEEEPPPPPLPLPKSVALEFDAAIAAVGTIVLLLIDVAVIEETNPALAVEEYNDDEVDEYTDGVVDDPNVCAVPIIGTGPMIIDDGVEINEF